MYNLDINACNFDKNTSCYHVLAILAFVFGVEYPKCAETVGDILQRQIARYGDDSGIKLIDLKISTLFLFLRY